MVREVMELHIAEEIDPDNLLDQIDGFMNYPVDDNESDGKSVKSIEGQEYDALTNSDPSVHFNSASGLSDELSVPYEDILQLEWLSTFVEDSFSSIGLTLGKDQFQALTSEPNSIKKNRSGYEENKKKKMEMTFDSFVHKCLHCGVTKTPQWRGGPLGPKTLCNACGVRYKSGRLFPEYRPAASPSFVPSLHSNSHKKVVEMRSKVGRGDAES